MIRRQNYNFNADSTTFGIDPKSGRFIDTGGSMYFTVKTLFFWKDQIVFSLKPEFKNPLILIYFNGFTYEETAKELKLPVGTVKTRVRIAIIELRGIFDSELA